VKVSRRVNREGETGVRLHVYYVSCIKIAFIFAPNTIILNNHLGSSDTSQVFSGLFGAVDFFGEAISCGALFLGFVHFDILQSPL